MFYYRRSHRTLPEELVFLSDAGRGVLLSIEPGTNLGKAYPVRPWGEEIRWQSDTYPDTTIGELQGYQPISISEARERFATFERAEWHEVFKPLLEEFRAALQQAETAGEVRA